MTLHHFVPTLGSVERKEQVMPKVSRETATKVIDMGPAGVARSSDLGGYLVEFVTVQEETDLTPLLKGLPNDECQCAHLGYVLKGRMWFRAGGEETSVRPGEAFYFTPGHTSGCDAGSEFVIFTPSDQMEELLAHMQKRAQELQAASQ
jgi:mannose-6-phosphate isomerase-like protein (cupin superfamily)